MSFIGVVEPVHITWVPFVATSVTLVSIFLAYRESKKENPFQMSSRNEIQSKLSFSLLGDYSNEKYFLVPFAYIAGMCKKFEKRVIDAFVEFVAKGSVVLAHLLSWGDRNIVDGGVKLTVFSIRSAGQTVRSLQSGKIQSYLLVTITGLLLLILWLVTF
jgi:NADH-quinone oxidoreductase subunit L